MSKVQEIIKQKKKRKERLESALETIKHQLINIGALKIILFGSLNEDNIDRYSDLDLFVVMPSVKTGKEWMDFIYKNIDREIATDIIVYNEKEFEKNLNKILYEAEL